MNRIVRDSTDSVFILHFHGLLPHLYGLRPCYSKWSQLSRSISFTWKFIKNCRTLRPFSIPDMSHNFHFTMDLSYVYTITVWEPLVSKTWMPNNVDESYMILLVSFYVQGLKKIMVSSKQENKLILSSTDDRSTHWPWAPFLFKVCLFCFRDDLNCPHPSSSDLSFS